MTAQTDSPRVSSATRTLRPGILRSAWRRGLSDTETLEALAIDRGLRQPAGLDRQANRLLRLCWLVVVGRLGRAHPDVDDYAGDLVLDFHYRKMFPRLVGRKGVRWRNLATAKLALALRAETARAELATLCGLLQATHAGDLPGPDPTGTGCRLTGARPRVLMRNGKLPRYVLKHQGTPLGNHLLDVFVERVQAGEPDELIGAHEVLVVIRDRAVRREIRRYGKAERRGWAAAKEAT